MCYVVARGSRNKEQATGVISSLLENSTSPNVLQFQTCSFQTHLELCQNSEFSQFLLEKAKSLYNLFFNIYVVILPKASKQTL